MEQDGIQFALGRAVRRRREAQGLTQKQLADLAGVHYQTVRSIELGRHGSSYKLGQVADTLGVDLGRLMYEAERGSSVKYPAVGELTRHLMGERGVTPDELTELMGVDREAVDRLIEGDAGPFLWGAAAVALDVRLEVYDAAVARGFDAAVATAKRVPKRHRKRR